MSPLSIIERYEKMKLAVELRRKGVPYDEIGKALGSKARSSELLALVGRYWVKRALELEVADEVEELRQQQRARLYALLAAYWDKAVGGEYAAAELVLRILDALNKLDGLAKERDTKPILQQAVIVLPDNQRGAIQVTTSSEDVSLLPS